MIINEYQRTPALLKEEYHAWFHKLIFPFFNQILALLAMISGAIWVINFPGDSAFLGYMAIVAGLLPWVLVPLRIHLAYKNALKRLRTLQESPTTTICTTIDGQQITIQNQGNEKAASLSLEAVEDVLLSPHLLILVFQGRLMLSLAREGFRQGSVEELLSVLEKRRKPVRWRALVIALAIMILLFILWRFLGPWFILIH